MHISIFDVLFSFFEKVGSLNRNPTAVSIFHKFGITVEMEEHGAVNLP